MARHAILIALYMAVDLVAFAAMKWLGASDVVAAFVVLAASINGVRIIVERRP